MRTLKDKNSLYILSFCASLLVACNGAGGNDIAAHSMVDTSELPRSGGAVELAAGAKKTESMPSDWESWVDAEVERLRTAEPELYNGLRDLQPMRTRAGQLRLSEPELVSRTDALPLLLDRLMNGNEPDAVRAAVAEAIGGTGAPFGPAVADLLERERDPYVRQVLVATLRLADAESAHRGLRAGLTDSDAGVRASAVYTAARRDDAHVLGAELLVAATDKDPGVQQAAVGMLGAIGVEEAKDTLVGLLNDDSPELRYLSLRALERIDASYAAALPQARAMRTDPDPRVAKLATRLTD